MVVVPFAVGRFFSLFSSLAMSIGVVFNREVRIIHLTEMGVPVLPLFWAALCNLSSYALPTPIPTPLMSPGGLTGPHAGSGERSVDGEVMVGGA